MGMESIIFPKGKYMMENGKMDKWKALEYLLILMAIFIKENLKIIEKMDKVLWLYFMKY